jgi:hypothetical protein
MSAAARGLQSPMPHTDSSTILRSLERAACAGRPAASARGTRTAPQAHSNRTARRALYALIEQWTEAAQQAQQAALEVWQASAGASDRLLHRPGARRDGKQSYAPGAHPRYTIVAPTGSPPRRGGNP